MAEHKKIRLSNGGFALVDATDFERLSQYGWNRHTRDGYVRRSRRIGKRTFTVYMHNDVLPPSPGMEVDHINSNVLDNRKANLRLCTRKQNRQRRVMRSDNTSGYVGVCFTRGRWQVTVACKFVGMFDTAEEAARAYDKRALEVLGEFARPNFPVK